MYALLAHTMHMASKHSAICCFADSDQRSFGRGKILILIAIKM